MTQTNSEDQETFVNKENEGDEIIDEQSGDETNEEDDQLLMMTPKVILKRLNDQRENIQNFSMVDTASPQAFHGFIPQVVGSSSIKFVEENSEDEIDFKIGVINDSNLIQNVQEEDLVQVINIEFVKQTKKPVKWISKRQLFNILLLIL